MKGASELKVTEKQVRLQDPIKRLIGFVTLATLTMIPTPRRLQWMSASKPHLIWREHFGPVSYNPMDSRVPVFLCEQAINSAQVVCCVGDSRTLASECLRDAVV